MADVTVLPEIEIAAKRLAEATHAHAVILFGSRARGDAGPESDWDLAVILPEDIAPQQFTPINLWELVRDIPRVTIQVYPLRRSVFLARKDEPNSVSRGIAQDGVALIGRIPEIEPAE